MKVGAIIQARTSSTRFPGKVLKKLPWGGKTTVLEQVLKRIRKSKNLSEIIVATTVGKEDDEIIKICEKRNVKWFRGSKKNVLSRFYLAAKKNKLDIIVRITSDCPCIDPAIIDLCIKQHLAAKADYTSNSLEDVNLKGMDVEVINFNVLENAYYNATSLIEKEHVTIYIYETNPNLFKITRVKLPKTLINLKIRLTLDTIEDYILLCTIYDYLYIKNCLFDIQDIHSLFKNKPWLSLINKK